MPPKLDRGSKFKRKLLILNRITERTAVVSAGRSRSKYVFALPHKQVRLAVNVVQERRIFRKTFNIDASSEIWPRWLLRRLIYHS
jgi:hypothetical protein